MIRREEFLRVSGVSAQELERWVEERLLLPEEEEGFEEVDVARARLIVELRRDFALDEEALPLVLSLLDQVYALRRQVRALCDALQER
jgi:chaperone modulatory protein CbpM